MYGEEVFNKCYGLAMLKRNIIIVANEHLCAKCMYLEGPIPPFPHPGWHITG